MKINLNKNSLKNINLAIDSVRSKFNSFSQEFFDNSRVPSVLTEVMKYSVLSGGKRIRPFLIIECAKIFGKNEDSSINTAFSAELVHCFSLIYDDLPCMDNDSLRRGKPTVHLAFNEYTALLAGSSLLIHAFKNLADQNVGLDYITKNELISELSHAIGCEGMLAGQFLDLEAEKPRKIITEKDFENIQKRKTGSLMSFCSRAGGIIGGASNKEKIILGDYGLLLGRIFQITDDLLDITGKKEELGKEVNKDKDKNKATLIKLRGFEEAKNEANKLAKEAKSKIKELNRESIILENLIDLILDRSN